MIVQFSASESNLLDEINYFRRIVKAIQASGCTLSLNWLEEAYAVNKALQKKKNDSRDWTSIHKSIIDALNRSDMCIFEASAKSFSVGFQTALALQMKKPTLVLARNDSLRNSFGSGIVSDLLTYKQYDDTNLEAIIHEFISSNDLKLKDLRFNFVIDREIHNYLRWAAFNTNTTKAEVIRRIIRARMDEKG